MPAGTLGPEETAAAPGPPRARPGRARHAQIALRIVLPVVALVALGLGAVRLFGPKPAGPPAAAPVQLAPQTSPSAPAGAPPQPSSTLPATSPRPTSPGTIPSAVPPTVQPPPKPVATTGQLAITVDPPQLRFAVLVNGAQKAEGAGRVALVLPGDQPQKIQIRSPEFYGSLSLGTVTLKPGEKQELGPVRWTGSTVTITALYPFSVRVGSASLPGAPAKKFTGVRLAAGEHILEIACEGHAVAAVIDFDTRTPLPAVTSAQGKRQFLVKAADGAAQALYVKLE
jgi:hypothetical protein